jgi:hypothetical protein
VRLASHLPFARAAEQLEFFWRVRLSGETVRRVTGAAGRAYVAVQEAERARIQRERPEPPRGPAVQQLSLDGALVPLVHGEWAEVKTAAIGTVVRRPGAAGEEAHAVDLSYFSRLAEAGAFAQQVLVEVERRGTQTAGTVAAVSDGSLWIQGVIDTYRPDAVRILDFPHAVEHLGAAAAAAYGQGTAAGRAWLAEQAHALKHEGPDGVLAALRGLPAAAAGDPAAALAAQAETLGYLEARLAQLRYPAFRAAGLPIGSGAVESACKLVVEARLKGSGMHWARANVSPMVALRTIACADRWAEAWPRVRRRLRQQARARRHALRLRRHPPAPPPKQPMPAQAERTRLRAIARHLRDRRPTPPCIVGGRPTADHPWRRPLLHRRQEAS